MNRLTDAELAGMDEKLQGCAPDLIAELSRVLLAELIARRAQDGVVREALESAIALNGVMFGRMDGVMPATVDTPIGIPVKVAAIQRDLESALSALQENGNG